MSNADGEALRPYNTAKETACGYIFGSAIIYNRHYKEASTS